MRITWLCNFYSPPCICMSYTNIYDNLNIFLNAFFIYLFFIKHQVTYLYLSIQCLDSYRSVYINLHTLCSTILHSTENAEYTSYCLADHRSRRIFTFFSSSTLSGLSQHGWYISWYQSDTRLKLTASQNHFCT